MLYQPLLFLFLLPITSLNILLPLYLYPGENGSAWNEIFATISAHPKIQFDVVVNPNSGPGVPNGPPTDPNIIASISKLNAFANVHTLGYVLTGHGSRDLAAITADVNTYASWNSISPSSSTSDVRYSNSSSARPPLHIGGIYFDESSNAPDIAMYNFYSSIASRARSAIPEARIAFNPGTIAATQYFEYCDLMVEFEASLSDYRIQDPVKRVPAGFRAKTGLQIYDTPADTDVSTIVAAVAGEGVGAIYFGADCCYKVWDAVLLKRVVVAVESG